MIQTYDLTVVVAKNAKGKKEMIRLYELFYYLSGSNQRDEKSFKSAIRIFCRFHRPGKYLMLVFSKIGLCDNDISSIYVSTD